MRTLALGPLHDVSRLTLGGGGLGQFWGETTNEEAIATVHAALDAGITLIDTAPMYRHCEAVIGEAFAGKPPANATGIPAGALSRGEPGPRKVQG